MFCIFTMFLWNKVNLTIIEIVFLYFTVDFFFFKYIFIFIIIKIFVLFDNKVDFILFGNFGSAQRKSFDSDLNFGSAQRKSFLCVWFREGAATAGMCLRRKEKLRKKFMWKAYLTIE